MQYDDWYSPPTCSTPFSPPNFLSLGMSEPESRTLKLRFRSQDRVLRAAVVFDGPTRPLTPKHGKVVSMGR
jgi:hypothetical protein